MSNHLSLLVLALSLFGLTSCAQTAGDTLILEHANLVDPSAAKVLLDQTIVIHSGIIVKVGSPAASVRGELLDLHGSWVLPGLIDAHVHVETIADAQRMLSLGITTGRSMLTRGYGDVGLRALYEQGARDIPTILAAGFPVVARPMKFLPSIAGLFLYNPVLNDLRFRERIGPDGARRIVAANAQHHVDWIKVFANERAGIPQTEPAARNLNDEELVAAVEEASRLNLLVASHTYSDDGALAAIRAGVRTIEHGALVTEPTLRLMQERDVCFTPTLAAYYHEMENPHEGSSQALMKERVKMLLAGAHAAIATARKLHVRIIAGTDTDYTEKAPTLIDEIVRLAEAGLSNNEALAAATSVSAACLGIEKKKGAVKAGTDADLVVYQEDPTKNLDVLRRPALVINGGKVIVNSIQFPAKPQIQPDRE